MIDFRFLDLTRAPYGAQSFKRDVLGAASLGANFLGGAAQSAVAYQQVAAQYDANKKNLQAVQETNQANKEIAEKQLEQYWKSLLETEDFNRSERIASQDYNSPVKQAELLKAAGFNPALMMGSGKGSVSGASISQGSLPAAAQMQAAKFNAPDYSLYADVANDIGSSVSNVLKDSAVIAQTNASKSSTDYTNAMTPLLVNESLAKSRHTGAQARYQELLNENQEWLNMITRNTASSDIESRKLANDAVKADIDLKVANKCLVNFQAWAQNKHNSWIHTLNTKDIELKIAQIATLYSQGKLSDAEAKAALASAAKSSAEAQGVRLNNKHIDDFANEQLKGMRIENEIYDEYGIKELPQSYSNQEQHFGLTKFGFGRTEKSMIYDRTTRSRGKFNSSRSNERSSPIR